MSQFTIQFILSLVWMIIAVLEKAARLVNTIIDICDDGIVNDSFAKPAWYQKLCSILSSLQDKKIEVENLTDEIRASVKKPE